MAHSTPLQLRRLIEGRNLVQVPGAYDPLTAKLVQEAGFPLCYMSGYATAASFGVPDNGTVGFDEMLFNATRIARAISIPLLADADTGYDDPAETARRYESAGVAGIQIEDQVWPKKCGHMEGKRLVSTDEMCKRLSAAVTARQKDGIVIVARTDAIAVEGFDAAIDRARRYAEAGADMLFVEAPVSREQLKAIPKRAPELPHLYNAAPKTPSIGAGELEQLGYRVAIYPGISFVANMLATGTALKALRDTGEQSNLEEWRRRFEQWNAFLGE